MPSWFAPIADRTGPYADAATTFLRTLNRTEFAAGTEGVRDLVVMIDDFACAELPQDISEDAFIEGAGSLLAMLVAAHHEDAHHVERQGQHAIRIGRFGFFDAFATVADACDADDTFSEVSNALRAINKERDGRGAISRVVQALQDNLSALPGGISVRSSFWLWATLADGSEIDLQSVARATDGLDYHSVLRATRSFAELLSGSPNRGVIPWSEAKSKILPRLVGPSFRKRLPPESVVFLSPFAGDLEIALQLPKGNGRRYVRIDELQHWQLRAKDVVDQAMVNLGRTSNHARFVVEEIEDHSFVIFKSGDALDATRLLLPALLETMKSELGSSIALTVPHRDMLVACDASDSDAVNMLKLRFAGESARAPHPISNELFVFEGAQLVPISLSETRA